MLNNNIMKKLYILSIIAIMALASCGRNYTCPVYSKAKAVDQADEGTVRVKTTEQKGKM